MFAAMRELTLLLVVVAAIATAVPNQREKRGLLQDMFGSFNRVSVKWVDYIFQVMRFQLELCQFLEKGVEILDIYYVKRK